MDLFLLVQQYTGTSVPVTEEPVAAYVSRPAFVMSVPKSNRKPPPTSRRETNNTLSNIRSTDPPSFTIAIKHLPLKIKSDPPPPPAEVVRPTIKLPVTNLQRSVPPPQPIVEVVPTPEPVRSNLKVGLSNTTRQIYPQEPLVKEVVPIPEMVRPNLKVPEINLQRQIHEPAIEEPHAEEEEPEVVRPALNMPVKNLQRQIHEPAIEEPPAEEEEPPEMVRPNFKRLVKNLQRQIHEPAIEEPHAEEEEPEVVRPALNMPVKNLQRQIHEPAIEEPPAEEEEPPEMVRPNFKRLVKNLQRQIHDQEVHDEEGRESLRFHGISRKKQVLTEELEVEIKTVCQKLECIALLTTTFEVANGRVERFFERLQLTEKYDLDFIIFVNKGVNIPGIETLVPYFNNVFVISTEIAEKDDVRVDSAAGLEYGGCSGPNILFLKSMKFCERYNTTLVIETDCLLQPSWLDSCINYVKYSGSFLIAGSNYYGKVQLDVNVTGLFEHVNGVAFYNTGSQYFKTLIDTTICFIKENAMRGTSYAYDVAIYECVLSLIRTKQDVSFWTYIYHNIIKTTLIVNFSLPIDASTPLSEITDKFPMAVIIHKKD